MEIIEHKIHKFFQNTPGVIAVYLYGSIVTGRIHSESDIDVGILFYYDQTLPPLEMFELQTKLAELLDRDVDLVCLNDVSIILRKQVISKGKPILIKDQHQLNHFVIRSFSDYVDLKITRRSLEKYFLNRRVLDG